MLRRPQRSLGACLLLSAACGAPPGREPSPGATVEGPGGGADAGRVGSGGSSDDAVERPTDGFLGGFFPIGVFGQPAWAMQRWADIGCNTMLGVPQGHDVREWDAQARQLGLSMIRRPAGDPAEDLGRTDLLAWALPDEPDVLANNEPCGGNCLELSESLSARWRRVDPTRKIFVNVAGPNVLLRWACDYCNGPGDEPPSSECFVDNDQCYPRILAAADWISQDIYPVTGWLPSMRLRDDVTVVGQALDRLREWTDKPLFAIIELSDQRLGFDGTGVRGPTADEYRAEVWHAIIHGARGIFYFPQAFEPFEPDAVPLDVFDEMIAQHARLDRLGPLLQAEADPHAVTIAAMPPLELTWRQTERSTWVFVLNTSGHATLGRLWIEGLAGEARVHDESRSVPVEAGRIIDTFPPYGLHVYVIGG